MAKQRVGITGANGTVGRVLLTGLGDDYDLVAFTRRTVDFPSTIVNFEKADEVKGVFEDLDAVIHLAADPSPSASWESIRYSVGTAFSYQRRLAIKVATRDFDEPGGRAISSWPILVDAKSAFRYSVRLVESEPASTDSSARLRR